MGLLEKLKRRCKECGWLGTTKEVLEAPSPFKPEETLQGCPKCRESGSLEILCDEPGCRAVPCCGLPTPDGYRLVCGEHAKPLWELLDKEKK